MVSMKIGIDQEDCLEFDRALNRCGIKIISCMRFNAKTFLYELETDNAMNFYLLGADVTREKIYKSIEKF